MEKAECQHAPICVITRQHGPSLQFAAVQRKKTFSFPWHKPPKAGARELSYNSLNLTHEFRSLFSPKVIFAGLLRKAFPQKHAFVDMSVFLWLRKQRSRFAQGQPKGYFQMKELDRTTEAIVPMSEMWRKLDANMRQYVSLRANMGQHCSLQLCRERTPFRSHGTSSSQGWRKRIVIQQSEFDP